MRSHQVIPITTGVLASRYRHDLSGCGPYPNAIAEGVDSTFQWSAEQCSPNFSLLNATEVAKEMNKCSQCPGGKWTYWQTGYFSVVAYVIGGPGLQWIVVLVALAGQLGTILSGVCCCACSFKVLEELRMMPKFIGWLYPRLLYP